MAERLVEPHGYLASGATLSVPHTGLCAQHFDRRASVLKLLNHGQREAVWESCPQGIM